MIIGISGKIGSGKDTVGKIIQYLKAYSDAGYTHPITINDYNAYHLPNNRKHSFNIKKFAGKLKQIVSILTGIPVEDLEKQEIKDMTFKELYEKGYISKSFYDSLDDY